MRFEPKHGRRNQLQWEIIDWDEDKATEDEPKPTRASKRKAGIRTGVDNFDSVQSASDWRDATRPQRRRSDRTEKEQKVSSTRGTEWSSVEIESLWDHIAGQTRAGQLPHGKHGKTFDWSGCAEAVSRTAETHRSAKACLMRWKQSDIQSRFQALTQQLHKPAQETIEQSSAQETMEQSSAQETMEQSSAQETVEQQKTQEATEQQKAQGAVEQHKQQQDGAPDESTAEAIPQAENRHSNDAIPITSAVSHGGMPNCGSCPQRADHGSKKSSCAMAASEDACTSTGKILESSSTLPGDSTQQPQVWHSAASIVEMPIAAEAACSKEPKHPHADECRDIAQPTVEMVQSAAQPSTVRPQSTAAVHEGSSSEPETAIHTEGCVLPACAPSISEELLRADAPTFCSSQQTVAVASTRKVLECSDSA
eukprot:SAG31_NODE_6484_length_2001_cov_1.014721_2_plen_423_part_00